MMAKKLPLSIACGDYEIIRALKDGSVQPDGIELTLLTDMDSPTRHWRFLRNKEFDVAELSSSYYIVAHDKGLPFRAIPVFPHRRFRHGFAFINTGKGITKPTDLIGRKVGVNQFQTTAVLWIRGILEHEYGVPHKQIDWYAELDEDIDFTPPKDLRLTVLPDDKSIETMLAEGELDAVLESNLIKPILDRDPRVGRLFPDYVREEEDYFRRTGIFPIMHVVAIREEIVARHPWVPINLFLAFQEAKRLAMRRMENPRIAPVVWYRESWERQEEIVGKDPWEYGLTERNRHTLATLLGYSYEQALIRKPATPEDLFLNVGQGRKRGEEFRI
jgi:4,5-dihydroxyphthalate decarboxylase